jgi:hypothetical protein
LQRRLDQHRNEIKKDVSGDIWFDSNQQLDVDISISLFLLAQIALTKVSYENSHRQILIRNRNFAEKAS